MKNRCEHNFEQSYKCSECGVTRMDIAHRKARQKEERREFNASRIIER